LREEEVTKKEENTEKGSKVKRVGNEIDAKKNFW